MEKRLTAVFGNYNQTSTKHCTIKICPRSREQWECQRTDLTPGSSQIAHLEIHLKSGSVNGMLILHVLRHLFIFDYIAFSTASMGTCGASRLLNFRGCDNPVCNNTYSFDVWSSATSDSNVKNKRTKMHESAPSNWCVNSGWRKGLPSITNIFS